MKEEALPGHKKEKRKKRRWDRKPQVSHWFSMTFGSYTMEILCDVPHITFREKKTVHKQKKNRVSKKSRSYKSGSYYRHNGSR